MSSAYKKEGAACLKEKKRGRKFGEKRQLTPAQEKEIRRILIDKSPDQMKLSFMLWTRAAVCQLVEEKYGITITLRNMSECLKRWG
ncbi:helix-turn-helix domain-containing protein [Petralouisia muris]|uniref:helix-turn-helix domain-containing protein n=1 Tax=Petralouisia muris TaxID=3032872 RepID=UPI0038CD1C1D